MKVSLWKSASNAGRSKTGPGQSIRGKISGPYPIPNPIDEEFPIRNPGTGIASPLGVEGKDYQLQAPPGESSSTAPAAVSALRPEVVPDMTTELVVVPSGSSPTNILPAAPTTITSPPRRTNPTSTFRYSAVSASTERTTQSKDGPQRKKSTIRSALGRLFGRKRKNGSQGSSEISRISALAGSSQHRSVSLDLLVALNLPGSS
jgi:hypothetical protein